jgi:hypothetical protein
MLNNQLRDKIIQLRFNAKYLKYFIEDLVTSIISYSDEEYTQKIVNEIIEEWNKIVKKNKIKTTEDLIKFIELIIKNKLPRYNLSKFKTIITIHFFKIVSTSKSKNWSRDAYLKQ